MNTITRTLASLDPQADAPTEITAQDEELLRTILDQPSPSTNQRSRAPVRRILVVAGAVAATVALGVTRIDIGGHQVGASPAAAEVLERAAEVTLQTSDPVVGPGQYLRTTLIEESWGAFYGTDAAGPSSIAVGRDGLPMAHQERHTRQIWIPHDDSAPWIFREKTVPLRNASKDAAIHNQGEPTRTWSQPSWSTKAKDTDVKTYLKTYDPDWYATLPRDPDLLLTRLKKEDPGEAGSSDEFYFQEVFSEVLRSGVAPADIRATLFKALAQQPSMNVVKGVANLDGHRGIALQFNGGTWQMLFDQDTGQYIGERATDPDFPAVAGLDADKTTWLSTVRTEVVDSAPSVR